MKLEIKIEGGEQCDVLRELREVLQLVKAGIVHSVVDSSCSSHYFAFTFEMRTRKQLEKKPSVKGKRK